MAGSSSPSSDDFSVFVLASDLGVDGRPFLLNQQRVGSQSEAVEIAEEEREDWHDCSQYLFPGEDFSDLEFLQFFRLQGSDRAGNRIFRVVGKYFPAPVVSGERLKKYVFHKICSELPEGPFCIVYMHSTVQKEDNCPGLSILRWIYEDLPSVIKDRLQVVYFIHPGLRSRLAFATLGRFLLSGGELAAGVVVALIPAATIRVAGLAGDPNGCGGGPNPGHHHPRRGR
ncbi:hypothetical protein CDL15_Pgr019085 [Punica granatum]|uniref:CRAL-TRIO domain-containing protein n=1 Tax=Punica granatum TaxID=22663 RepID=A0A218XLW6_PUNGR|nr:hypothetical protein CDL15_Pgr019085 [Punica granatum]